MQSGLNQILPQSFPFRVQPYAIKSCPMPGKNGAQAGTIGGLVPLIRSTCPLEFVGNRKLHF